MTKHLYHKIEILLKASRNDTLEIVEYVDSNLELAYYDLMGLAAIEEIKAPFNCQPFRDDHGYEHTFKHIRITSSGLKLFKELIQEIKQRKALGETISP